jgi:O-antigen ligase
MRASAGILGFFLVLTGLFIALFCGLLSVFGPWWVGILLFTPFALVALGARWPLAGLAFVVLAVFGIFPVASGKLVDFLVMGFIGFIMLLRWQSIPTIFVRFRVLWFFMAALVIWAVLEGFYGFFYRRNFSAFVYSETTSYLYWLIAIASALLSRDERGANTILKTLVGISVVLCIVSVLQSTLGVRLNLSAEGRIEKLSESAGGIAGLYRSILPGGILVTFTFLLALAHVLKKDKNSLAWGFVLLITGVGLFLTLGRALWAVVTLLSILVALSSGFQAARRMLVYAGLFLVIAVPVILATKPAIIDGVVNRVTSVANEGGSQSSLGWRITENYYAQKKIASSPWIGLGMGAEYKPRLIDNRIFSEQTHYIHNGYFYILLKAGVVGLVLYMMLFFYVMGACLMQRGSKSQSNAPQLALAATMFGSVILNFTQPEFTTGPTVLVLGILSPLILGMGLRKT